MKFLTHDNPSFLASILICALCLLYYPHYVVDYHPSLEMCRVLGYPLLATGIATFLLRPGNRFAQWGLLISLSLSIETFCTLLLRCGFFFDFFNRYSPGSFSSYFLLFKLSVPLLKTIGVPYWLQDTVFNLLMTCVVFCICARTFSPARWFVVAAVFLASFGGALALLSLAALTVGKVHVVLPMMWLMVLYTILFWHSVALVSKPRETTA